MGVPLKWVKENRTLLVACAATLTLAVLVFFHRIEPGRCAVALIFAWGLATHSADIRRHQTEVVAVLAMTAKAGVELKAGEAGVCGEDLVAAGKGAKQLVDEVRQERAEG